MFDLVKTKAELPAIGSTVYSVSGCQVIKGIVTKYSVEGCNKYLHGIDSNGTWFRNIGALGDGMFTKKADALKYLETY